MPTEQEMLPKDKYTVFDRKVKRYRKGIHSKWLENMAWNCGQREGEHDWDNLANHPNRGTEMDKSQSETQPPGFLNWHVYVVELCTPCGIMYIASEGKALFGN